MTNPWTKKNPLMSMWLSGASAVANRARPRDGGNYQAKHRTDQERNPLLEQRLAGRH
jgi:hypothetical protein